MFLSVLPMESVWAQNYGPVTQLTNDRWYYIKYGDKFLSYSGNKVVLIDAPDLGASWVVESQTQDQNCTSWRIKNYRSNTYLGYQQREACYVANSGERSEPYTITTYQDGSFALLSAPIWWSPSSDMGKAFYMTVNDQNQVIGSESKVGGWQFVGGLTKEKLEEIVGNAALLLKARRLYLLYGTSVNHITYSNEGDSKTKFSKFESALKAITGEDVANATEETMRNNSTDDNLKALKFAYDTIDLISDVKVVPPVPGTFYRLKGVAGGKYLNCKLNNGNRPTMTTREENDCLSTLMYYTKECKLQFLESGLAINSEGYNVSTLDGASVMTIDRSQRSANETLGSYSISTSGSSKYLYANTNNVDRFSGNGNHANCEWYLEEIEASSLSYTRAMSNQWGTLCLPYPIEANAAKYPYDFYQIQSMADDVLTINKIADGTIAAGTPVIVRRNTGESGITIPAAGNTLVMDPVSGSTASGLTLTGTFVGTGITNGYYIAKDAFWQVPSGKTVTVGNYRAYFDGAVSGASQLRIAVAEEESTGLNETIAEPSIETLYNLSGQQISSLQKGVNLVRKANGTVQKIVIR